ncbi:SMP-30/gluconolactonase/LRE family protein [Alteromonas gilva]|uniref:SMP-30/gluconolactonase/LRE family protein n=1 Tax=Alteromonas gilva TaxID=2987522 RepID=A0ABT5L1F5_9ALTE|nr:SMP-30/gluconolactonase/LRE family protein [Alteromonas gilva]MDC8829702.1 SMP-30/gluconolactonase/LRE family protein [Alteromonas gilva]
MSAATIINTYPTGCELGEGIHYSASLNCVFWVDIKQHQLFRLSLNDGVISRFNMPEPIGWIKQTRTGNFIVGLQSGIYLLNSDFTCGEQLCAPRAEPATNRLNDAKTDRQGRLYFGSMDNYEKQQSGNLYQLCSVTGADSPRLIDSDYKVSNGPAINLAGDKLYSVSSSTRTIFSFRLETNGNVTDKQVFIQLPEQYGFPDGITVDSQDNIWVACWMGHSLCCFSPQGELLRKVIMPAPLITNITFAGANLDRAFVTSARIGLSAKQLQQYPLSGSVFELSLNTTGLPEALVAD